MELSPKISVIMPVYNGKRHLEAALLSILKQDFGDFELLVIDDGSTDESVDIIRSFDDTRIRLVKNESNLGLVKTRNRGVAEAKGQYIAFLDCDDISLKHRLRVQSDFLDKNPEFVLIGSWILLIDDTDQLTGEFSCFSEAADNIPSLLLFENYFAQSAVMIRREILLNERYREPYPCAEDYDLFARIAAKGKVWNIPDVLTLYRYHNTGISKTRRDLIISCTQKIFIWQLEKLGIAPSKEELDIHCSIGYVADDSPEYSLLNIQNWLKKLLFSNNKLQIYPDTIFKHQILEKMALTCTRKNCGIYGLLRYYLNFPDTSWGDKFFVLLKILKRNLSKKAFKFKNRFSGKVKNRKGLPLTRDN